ncbi:hypothetical protein BM534_04270 [Clostridioides difficile]|nr:hypothetical protein BM534_04270 [Clostridioides difficile]
MLKIIRITYQGYDYTAEGDSSANTITITSIRNSKPSSIKLDLDNVSVLVKAGAVSETTANRFSSKCNI